jgi:predicted dehydrogenase
MDLLRWIAGDPTEVFAYANHKVLTDWPVDDCTISILKYPNEVIGKVLTSIGCKRPYTMRTQLFGSKGTILGDNKSSYITLFTPCIDEKGKHSFKEEQIPIDINHHNMAAEISDMCDIILGKKELEIDVIEGANTIAVCLAAVESAASGLPVKPHYFS